jgi:hypothetical protein
METETIRIDFEVYKALTMRRSNAQVSYNDVLRELLELSRGRPAVGATGTRGAWTAKGVVFPGGTEFRGRYKGRVYEAQVSDGALVYAGKRFDTPSRAAMEITDSQTDGWKFWECRRPGDSAWTMIKSLRAD